MSFNISRSARAGAVMLVTALSACANEIHDVAGPADSGLTPAETAAALFAVTAGNQQAMRVAPSLVPDGTPLAPFVEARMYAMTNLAMHDAANAIVPRYERYADRGPIISNANPAAAILTAAFDVITGSGILSTTDTDIWYATYIKMEAANRGYSEGVALGHRVASAILALRLRDGTSGGGVAPYHPGTQAGDYQFTLPFNTPGFDFFGTGGFADASRWGATVSPFSVTSTSQFRAPPPYGAASNSEAVLTDSYRKDFDEVKSLGCSDCKNRSSEQTEIALFWLENSPTAWNRVARSIALDSKLDAWDSAHLLALVQVAEFDAYATNLESKYQFNFWRPVTAVALAGADGNPMTEPDLNWGVLGFPTPPVPDYPSAHAAAGGAAAAVIRSVLPGFSNSLRLTSASLPGVTRSFVNVDAAARENSLSRIYVGFHFRQSVDVGEDQGHKVGEFVARASLTRISK